MDKHDTAARNSSLACAHRPEVTFGSKASLTHGEDIAHKQQVTKGREGSFFNSAAQCSGHLRRQHFNSLREPESGSKEVSGSFPVLLIILLKSPKSTISF